LGIFLFVLNGHSPFCYINFYDINHFLDKIINNYYSGAVFVVELDRSLSRVKDLEDYYFTKKNLPLAVVISCDFNQELCIQQEAILNDYKSNYVYVSNNEYKKNRFLDSSDYFRKTGYLVNYNYSVNFCLSDTLSIPFGSEGPYLMENNFEDYNDPFNPFDKNIYPLIRSAERIIYKEIPVACMIF